MECSEMQSVLYKYMDGELHVWRRVRVRAHLERCPRCQHAHDFELEVKECVRRACISGCEPPPDLAEKIRRALGD